MSIFSSSDFKILLRLSWGMMWRQWTLSVALSLMCGVLGIGSLLLISKSMGSLGVVTLLTSLLGVLIIPLGITALLFITAYSLKLVQYVSIEGRYLQMQNDSGPLTSPSGVWQPIWQYWPFIWRQIVFTILVYALILVFYELLGDVMVYLELPLNIALGLLINFMLFRLFFARQQEGLRFRLVSSDEAVGYKANAPHVFRYIIPLCIGAYAIQTLYLEKAMETTLAAAMADIDSKFPDELSPSYYSSDPECVGKSAPQFAWLMQARELVNEDPASLGAYFQVSGNTLYRIMFPRGEGTLPYTLFMTRQGMMQKAPSEAMQKVTPDLVKQWLPVSLSKIGFASESHLITDMKAPDGSTVVYTPNLRGAINAAGGNGDMVTELPGYYIQHSCFTIPIEFPSTVVMKGEKEWLGWVEEPAQNLKNPESLNLPKTDK